MGGTVLTQGTVLVATGLAWLAGFVVLQVRADTRRGDWSTPLPGPGWLGWLVLALAVVSILYGAGTLVAHVAGLFSD
jgi:hypothetical protein